MVNRQEHSGDDVSYGPLIKQAVVLVDDVARKSMAREALGVGQVSLVHRDAKLSKWKLPPENHSWLLRARHDASLARDWDTRALRVLERGDDAKGADLARRGAECWVGALTALLRGLA